MEKPTRIQEENRKHNGRNKVNIWTDWLVIVLKENGISKRQLCRDTGINRETVRTWFAENGDVRLRNMLIVLDYLGYDIVFRKRR